MKKLFAVIALFCALSFTSNSAQAQITTGPDVIAAAGNLVNIQIGDVNVNAPNLIDVTNVLNNNDVDIRALNNILNGLSIDNVLNNLLRDSLNKNQVVVGVIVNALGEVTQVVVADKRALRNK